MDVLRGCKRCNMAGKEFLGHDWRNCPFNPAFKKVVVTRDNIAEASNVEVSYVEESVPRGCMRCRMAQREFISHDGRNCKFNHVSKS